MDGAVWGFIGVVVGGVITGSVTIGAEIIRGKREGNLDSAKRRDDRRLDRDHFQRTTLLELQEAVNDLARAAFQVRWHDLIAYRNTGNWREAPLPASIDETEQVSHLRVFTLRSRIADPDTRKLAASLMTATRAVSLARDDSASEAATETVGDTANRLMERTGELILATFEPESPGL